MLWLTWYVCCVELFWCPCCNSVTTGVKNEPDFPIHRAHAGSLLKMQAARYYYSLTTGVTNEPDNPINRAHAGSLVKMQAARYYYLKAQAKEIFYLHFVQQYTHLGR